MLDGAVEIRKATIVDVDHIVDMAARLHAEGHYATLLFDSQKTRSALASFIVADNYCCFVAAASDSIVGAICGVTSDYIFCSDKVAYDLGLYVLPHWRKRSVAAMLVASFEAWAVAQGAREACLSVSTGNNEQTARLYGKLGFVHVGGVYRRLLK